MWIGRACAEQWPREERSARRYNPGVRSRVLLVAAAALTIACADSDPEAAHVSATYDEATGRLTRIEADLDRNGKIDTYTYMDGTKVLRSEIDADEDGQIEKWEFHGDDGRVVKVAISREKNGVPDAWMYPGPDGEPSRAEMSSEQDESKIDRWEWYEDGLLVRAEEDASGDGRVDKWETYRGGAIVFVELDEDYDGRADRRLTYGAAGQLRTIESEPDGAGGFRKRLEIGR